jgi:uncharacterized protein YecE (DUF72 family)
MEQESLFDLPPAQLEAAPVKAEVVELAARLPANLYFGGMSWSYRGWVGHVYGLDASDKRLASQGLTAYGKHPLLRCVEIDRTYYEPLPADTMRAFAQQVPDSFRFFAKAHEDCVVQRFPEHARYGVRRGAHNPRFLDPVYAREAVVAPLIEGLGPKLAGVLFQFPPQDASDPRGFALRLGSFLKGLPVGVPYAIELRNPELLTHAYAQALEANHVIHCHNLWTAMPSLHVQARRLPPAARRPLLIRWLLRAGHRYEDASAAYAPFHRLVDEDLETRNAIAQLSRRALQHDVPVYVLVDNKAEGCAPESIVRLARAFDAGAQVR